MRLQALDLLRFIAALAVVAYHYLGTSNPSYPQLAGIAQFGYLGVPLFFMISGFVIFMTLEDETGTTNAIVWPKTFERYRPVVMGARLVALRGRLQKAHGVIHVVADHLVEEDA